jgi:hypothetical protein
VKTDAIDIRKPKMKRPYFLVKPAIVLPLGGAFFLALHAQQEWATSAYWPTSALAFISALFPPISGYAGKSLFPGVTQMYMAFTFLLMPLHAWYTYQELSTLNSEPWFKNLWSLDSTWAFVKRVGLVLVMSAIVLFCLFVNPGYDFNLMPLNSSRLALGLGGWIVAGGLQGAGLAWIYCNLIVFARFLRRSRNHSVK